MSYKPATYYRSCLGLILAPTLATIGATVALAFVDYSNATPRPQDIVGMMGFAAFAAMLGAYPATIILGLPIFWTLVWLEVRATPQLCTSVGAIIAAAPAILWAGLLLDRWGLALAVICLGGAGGFLFWRIAGSEINNAIVRPRGG